MSLLLVEKVSKRFGSLVAVNDISLTVELGELRAVIGPNGAGKTTFFNLISGFLTPTSGRSFSTAQDITDLCRRAGSGAAWRAPFRSPRSFPN